MEPPRQIVTPARGFRCALCGRRLLLGERLYERFERGAPRPVCELCLERAREVGWLELNGAGRAAEPTAATARRFFPLWRRRRKERDLGAGGGAGEVFPAERPPASPGERFNPRPDAPNGPQTWREEFGETAGRGFAREASTPTVRPDGRLKLPPA